MLHRECGDVEEIKVEKLNEILAEARSGLEGKSPTVMELNKRVN